MGVIWYCLCGGGRNCYTDTDLELAGKIQAEYTKSAVRRAGSTASAVLENATRPVADLPPELYKECRKRVRAEEQRAGKV